MPSPRYGASPEDWEVLSQRYGLTADLLPVVSNPGAIINPGSTLKDKGKVPTRYNRERKVVGFAKWTQYKATAEDVASWSREPDYGVCVQTRYVRALDIDIADPDRATRIVAHVSAAVGGGMPLRVRENSGKCLLMFRLGEQWKKRRLKVDGGVIEFLADGQQFVAAGTHPSGARYNMLDGWPIEIPEITGEQFEEVWAGLVRQFGVEDATTVGAYQARRPVTPGAAPVYDPVLERLDVIGWGAEGQAFITCPFEDEHTTESGESATCYFPKGSRGYAKGHFKCLHAHCEGRDDGDFINALGVVAMEFEEIPEIEVVALTPDTLDPLPNGITRNKKGVEPTQSNIIKAMRYPRCTGFIIKFDEFRDEIMTAPVWAPDELRAWRDPDYVDLRMRLEQCGFPTIGREILRDSVAKIADENTFDSAEAWLDGLAWDGVSRVAGFLSAYFSAEDTPYTRAVSLYLWTALAGRVLSPGVQADMVPVLVGAQGVGKTRGIAAMVAAPEHYGTVDLMARDADLSRRMRGKLVLEIGELRGLHSRDLESIKEFITRTHEQWVPKYREFAASYPRRSVFIGSTNQPDFLADTTGNRRWLPVGVGKVDVASIARDRLQLWAEGRELYKIFGIEWQDAKRLAEGVHDDHTMTDIWEERIATWLHTSDLDGSEPRERVEGFTLGEVVQHALNCESAKISKHDQNRVCAILRKLGFNNSQKRVEGRRIRVWLRVSGSE